MQFICLAILLITSTSLAMESDSTLSLDKAKKRIDKAIGLDYPHHVEPLLRSFGAQLTQKEKDHYLSDCYSRPRIAPMLLAIGAYSNMHMKCECDRSFFAGLPNSCKKDSILHWAARYGNSGVVKALLNFKADVNAVEVAKHETPLMQTCRVSALASTRGDLRHIHHYTAIITDLLGHGANINLVNIADKTALQIAQTEIVNPQHREIIVKCLSKQKIV